MRVLITGYLATYPLGGLAWHYLHYLLGTRALGHDVFYLEDTGNWMYDPVQQTFTDNIEHNVAAVAATLRRFGFGEHWAVRGPDGRLHGPMAEGFSEVISSADVLLNVSGSCWLRDEYRRIPRKVYIDTDPGFNQIRAHRVMTDEVDEELRYSVQRMAAHDVHFTFGLNATSPCCLMPETPFSWVPTRQPVALEHWPVQGAPARRSYSTVMSWNAYAAPLKFRGVSYHGKEKRLRRLMDLPARSPVPLEIAASGQVPTEELQSGGWKLQQPQAVSATPEDFRHYVSHARGEFSVAKDLYVEMRTGWFGDRSAGYLASGRPAILEDTGFSAHLPTGEGLLAFTDLHSAADAIARVESDYAIHAKAAREVAEACFAAPKVLPPLLGV